VADEGGVPSLRHPSSLSERAAEKLLEPDVFESQPLRGPALIVDAVGRVGEEERGVFARHEPIEVVLGGRITTDQAMLTQGVVFLDTFPEKRCVRTSSRPSNATVSRPYSQQPVPR
jgi:hypothetical protein